MYNVKRVNGTFKGLIGECLFKDTDNSVILTRFFAKNKWLDLFGDRISPDQRAFLLEHWYSIDAIRIPRHNQPLLIFEVKTRNRYPRMDVRWVTKFSRNTVELYVHAQKIGIVVSVVTIWLEDEWNYTVQIEDFSQSHYVIDRPKEYDAKAV